MTRVLHTADTHVGYRQYHSPERRRDFLAAFERVVADAVADDVDAVVHAGDVFHDRRPDVPDLLGTVAALRELEDAGIPFLAVVGNHEDRRSAQWLDLFETLGLATRLDAEGFEVGAVTLYGLDYVPRSRRDELDYAFAEPDTEYAALVAHGLFEPFPHADWDTGTVLAESTVDFDAMLLGDNHHPDTARVDGTWVTYAGSTERTSADEEADRGYNLVTFGADEGDAAAADDDTARDDDTAAADANAEDDDGAATDGVAIDGTAAAGEGVVRITRRGLPTREFHFVDVELREGEGVERVRERVRERDCEDAVVVVRIDGEGEPVTPADVEAFADEQGALVARVNDRRTVDVEEGDLEVSFADPDDAVRERVRALGLSGAARGLDETVRSGDVADSNVRDAVRDRVETLLEDDPEAFRPAEDAAGEDAAAEDAASEGADGEEGSDAGEEGSDAGEENERAEDSGGDAGEDEVDAGEETADADPQHDTERRPDSDADPDADADPDLDAAESGAAEAESGGDAAGAEDGSGTRDAGDDEPADGDVEPADGDVEPEPSAGDQASMEEYL